MRSSTSSPSAAMVPVMLFSGNTWHGWYWSTSSTGLERKELVDLWVLAVKHWRERWGVVREDDEGVLRDAQ